MKTTLAHGRRGIELELPDDNIAVIEPRRLPGLPDPDGAIRTAIRYPVADAPPLRRLARVGDSVAIAVSATHTTPTSAALLAILRELSHLPDGDIAIVSVDGYPRSALRKWGDEIVSRRSIFSHSPTDDSELASVGVDERGAPITLNRQWASADVRIALALVEPHPFAGFSGASMTVAAGLSGFETANRLYGADRIGNPNAGWGIVDGNPIHAAIENVAQQANINFAVEFTANRDGQLTSVYAGDAETTHRAARRFAKRMAMRAVDAPFDVAITTDGGSEDGNAYSAARSVYAAAQVVKRGGTVVCASEREAGSLQASLEAICAAGDESPRLERAWLYAKVLAHRTIRARLVSAAGVESVARDAIAAAGHGARTVILPHGAAVVPYLDDGRLRG